MTDTADRGSRARRAGGVAGAPPAGSPALAAELRERLAEVRRGGGETRAARGTSSAASCSSRDRVDRLLDPGSPFLELSPLAALRLYDDDVPGGRHRHRHRPRRRA